MDLIKHFWYLVHVERQNETELKTVRTTLDSAIFRQFGICFGLCDIAG